MKTYHFKIFGPHLELPKLIQPTYARIVNDQRRSLISQRVQGTFCMAASLLALLVPEWRLFLLLTAAYFGYKVLIISIDQSNRDFFLHMIDYDQLARRIQVVEATIDPPP
jgi:hypothetical protein